MKSIITFTQGQVPPLSEKTNEEGVMLNYNLQRRETIIERLRVFGGHLAIEKAKALRRKHAGTNPLGNSPEGQEGGNARDIAARKVGMDGRHAEIGLMVLEEIERQESCGGDQRS